MTKLSKIIAIFCMPTLLCCCKDDELSIKLSPYMGDELRIDGYYYKQWENKTAAIFFYRNGTILTTYAHECANLNDFEGEMINLYDKMRNDKSRWGVFEVQSKTIRWSGWSTSVGGGLPSFECIGAIENDTTFRITKSVNSDGKEFEKNDIYHFRQFYPKPDSTNTFIK